MRDLFPTTHATWLVTHIDSDPAVARDHVMARYFEPLCAYTRASSLRSFGEPADLVNDFFAARLCDASYLSRWSASGLSLRRWLANGLLLHTRNTRLAARRRAEHGTSAPNDELERAAALRASDHETTRSSHSSARGQCAPLRKRTNGFELNSTQRAAARGGNSFVCTRFTG